MTACIFLLCQDCLPARKFMTLLQQVINTPPKPSISTLALLADKACYVCQTLVIALVLWFYFTYVCSLVLCSSFRSLDQGWQNCKHIDCHNFPDWCQQKNFICEDATTFMRPRHSLHITTSRPVVRNSFLGRCSEAIEDFCWKVPIVQQLFSIKIPPPPPNKNFRTEWEGEGG